ncbi:hypothetical protein ABC502_07935 [Alkalimonas sp. NCh-2]|uniref:hypothetical protein n=1 Tax=Alkalimonas sp. NCh-2 TaxID=3144846 RepID=UPI0031F62431
MPLIKRKFTEPDRENPTWEERWKGEDAGLITSWEVGRHLRRSSPELAVKASNGELPVLDFKGGYAKSLKKKQKIGSLNYLAQWQALRGEDLHIDTDQEYVLSCSKTGNETVFTHDNQKLGVEPDSSFALD